MFREEDNMLYLEENDNTYVLDMTKLKDVELSLRSIPHCLSFSGKRIVNIPIKIEFSYAGKKPLLCLTAFLTEQKKYRVNFILSKEKLINLFKNSMADKHDITEDLLKNIDYTKLLFDKIHEDHANILMANRVYDRPVALLNDNKVVCVSKTFSIDSNEIIHLLEPVGTWNTEFKDRPEQVMVLCYIDTVDFAYVKFTNLEATKTVDLSIIDDKNPFVQKLEAQILELKNSAEEAGISIEQYLTNTMYKNIKETEVLDF